MFRFENIELLWGLLAIPLFVLLFIFVAKWKQNALKLFGELPIINQLMPEVSKGKPILKLILFSLAYTFLIFGLANPQIGTKLKEVKREGVDLMITLDVSNSMLAEDLSPNRLERAKRAISQLVDRLHNDRIGIIVFGGQAYVQLPITTDYAAAKLFLSTINTGIIPKQGTAIGNAIDLAVESFDFDSKSGKAIIVITDGENHEDDAVASTQKATEKGVVVHTIGMGSAQGAPIPAYRRGQQIDYRKDKEGNTVVTKLNEQMLQEIAIAGNGTYVRATNAQAGLKHIMEKVNKMEKAEFGTKMYTDYEDRFQYFIGIALILLLIEFLISERKSRWLSDIKLFEVKNSKKTTATIITLLCLAYGYSQEEKKYIIDGNKKYKDEKFEDAEKEYAKALEKNAVSFEGKFNQADALFKLKKYEEAAQQFNSLATEAEDKKLKAQAYHNLGNSLLQSEKLEECINAYKNALRNNPEDDETRYNLAYALKTLQQQEQQQQQQQQNQDKNQENQDKKESKDQKQQENKDKKEQEQKDQQQDQKKQDEQQQQPKPNELSKEDVERLLEAMQNEERNTQEKVKKRKVKATRVQIEKDW